MKFQYLKKKNCIVCGEEYTSYTPSSKFCASEECRLKWQVMNGKRVSIKRIKPVKKESRNGRIIPCKICGKDFETRCGRKYCVDCICTNK